MDYGLPRTLLKIFAISTPESSSDPIMLEALFTWPIEFLAVANPSHDLHTFDRELS